MSRKPFELPNGPDPFPDLPVERGPGDKGVGYWVPEKKHTLVAKYIAGTSRAMAKWPRRIFIDPFCGPGRIQVKGESFTRFGGAPVAWRQSELSGSPFTQVLIGDKDVARVKACEKRLVAIGAPTQGFEGAAVDTVPRMVASVPKGSLCLAYIDPYNLEYLDFSILKELASLPNVDFAVHFSLMDLSRNVDMELDPTRARFDGALPGWRSRVPALSKASLQGWFFQEWNREVEALGFTASVEKPLVQTEGKRLYRLVFFRRHGFPGKIWGDVAKEHNLSLDFEPPENTQTSEASK